MNAQLRIMQAWLALSGMAAWQCSNAAALNLVTSPLFLGTSVDANVLPVTQVPAVLEQWRTPSHEEFTTDGKTVWQFETGVQPNKLVGFDPKTEQFQSWPIPSGGIHAGIVRHMRTTREGNLLIHQSSTNRIILVELEVPAVR